MEPHDEYSQDHGTSLGLLGLFLGVAGNLEKD